MCFLGGIIELSVCKAFDEAVKAGTKAGKYVRQYRMYLADLETEWRSLQYLRGTIERRVDGARDRGEEIEDAVSRWQEDAGRMENDVQQLIGQVEARMHCFACSCPNIKWRYRLGKQAEEKIAAVKQLAAQGGQFDVISHPRPPPPELEFPSAENYVHLDSRTPILEAIVGALKDPNVKMIGVHGPGGVGKTTLVEKVAKKMLDDGTFKQVPLAVVSKVLNVKEIQKKLAGKLNLELKATADENAIAIQLWNKFKKGDKLYLVILDDIWEKVDLNAIGIPIADGTTGCKVVLTSRNKDLLRITMKADINFPIAELSEAEAWDLFKKKVGNTIESWPEIDSLAREVCRKCEGLPIAINALGAALEDKQVYVWKNALDKLEKHMLTQIEGIDPSVWVILSLSYKMLRSLDAQSCFLLCCLLAENAEIPIDELVRHCMARSLLAQNPHTFDEATTAVRTVVDVLKSASLLSTDDYETVVKIHDVIRDVGISIAREKEAFLIDHGVARWPRNPKKEPLYSTISISFKDIKELPDGLEYPQLETLMVDNSKLSDIQVPDNFFNGMTQLTALTITRMRMLQLPSSLAKLKNLRMLYLKKCELGDIAILKDLKNKLEVLNLRGSCIEVLPPEIGQLTSLRVLDLQDCDELMVIPQSVISDLISLEELYFPQNFFKLKATTDKRQDTSSRETVTLKDLRGLLSTSQLTTLHVYIPDVMLLPKEDLIFENLKGFKISVGSEIKTSEVISARCMLKLKGIQLRNEFIPLVDKAEVVVLSTIEGLKKVFHDRGVGNRFLDLKYLKVTSCVEDLEYLLGEPKTSVQSHGLHRLRPFNNLTVLIIEYCKSKYLFSPTTAKGLVHLEELKVRCCEIMDGIVGFEERNDEDEFTGEVKFRKLKQLELIGLPNLVSFYAQKEKIGTTMGTSSSCARPLFSEKVIFPVLERLTIDGLGNIIKIWDKQSVVVLEEQESFCQLTDLEVERCSKLMHVFSSNMHPLLKNLKKLEVKYCETMKGIVEFEGEIDEDRLRNEVVSPAREHLEMVGVTEIQEKQPLPEPRKEVESLCRPVNNNDIIVFPRLKRVKLWTLPKLKSFYTETQSFFSNKVAFPVLEILLLAKLDKITRIWDNQPLSKPEKEAKSLCQLMMIEVFDCNQLEYVLPFYMLPQLKNLQELCIERCRKMEVIISNNPKEKEATNNNDTIRFPQLKTLKLEDLPNLKSFICCETQLFFSNKVAFPVLKILLLAKLEKITRIWDNQSLSEREKEAKSFCELMVIKVEDCDQLEYVLPSYMLPQLKNLQRLMIQECRKMEVIISNNPKEKEATNNNDTIRFPQLCTLHLEGLPNLKSFICSDQKQLFFSNKDAFPVLESISLDEDSEILRDETYTKEVSMENNKMADTSAAQARKGKDIQGIPWERLNITREKRRQTRLEQYKNYENIPQSGEGSKKDCKVTMKGGMYYEFRRNSRSVKSTIPHFQLRNLVWATSKNDVYFMSHFSVTHWSALTCNKTEVLNFSGHVAPCEKHPGSLVEGFTQTEVSTLAVKDRLLVVGGYQGELICKNLDRPGVCFCTKTTYDDNAVTNAVEIYSTQSGAVHFTVANNDCGVRDFDMEQFQLSKHFSFPWPVNHTSMSPDGKLRIIVGDNPEGMLVDSGTGKMVASLVGHLDFSFASAWHPDGLTFATGNQDKTCRIWDARNLSKSVAALKGNLGAIRSIRYSSDGRFMAMAEPADFVHVFDAKSGYEKEQEIDFFGRISGMSFSPDTESLFIGVCGVHAAVGPWDRTYGGLLEFVGPWDRTYGGLLEFGRRRNNSCPDSIF